MLNLWAENSVLPLVFVQVDVKLKAWRKQTTGDLKRWMLRSWAICLLATVSMESCKKHNFIIATGLMTSVVHPDASEANQSPSSGQMEKFLRPSSLLLFSLRSWVHGVTTHSDSRSLLADLPSSTMTA